MVHPLVITAAATASVGAAVAFELAVFRPWRDENWPHGFGEGVRSEFLKLRREVEQAVNEISGDLRTLRDGRRRGNTGNGNPHRRLSDGEPDDFRRGVGEEASSESAQHEFEMHERQASAYRDRLKASMTDSLTSGRERQDATLRRRRPTGADDAEEGGSTVNVPVVDVRRSKSPEVPHHSLGDDLSTSSEANDTTSTTPGPLETMHKNRSDGTTSVTSEIETIGDETDSDAARNELLGLDFSRQTSSSPNHEDSRATTTDPFDNVVDGTASSWHAVFSDRTTERDAQDLQDGPDEGHLVLDTNGLSQTLSDQQHSFHDLYIDTRSSNDSASSDSVYRSNRALHSPSLSAVRTSSNSGRSGSEPDFEVLSDTADSQGRWSHVDAPPSPTISSGSEPAAVRGIDAMSVASDGQESWAELSEPGDGEDVGRGETRVRSLRG